jgi:hypothetical protein
LNPSHLCLWTRRSGPVTDDSFQLAQICK